jgi:hypothetical protein
MAAGYTSLANTILHDYNFFDYDVPFTPTPQPHSTTKYEYTDLGAGEEMLQLANPAGNVNILVKFSS